MPEKQLIMLMKRKDSQRVRKPHLHKFKEALHLLEMRIDGSMEAAFGPHLDLFGGSSEPMELKSRHPRPAAKARLTI